MLTRQRFLAATSAFAAAPLLAVDAKGFEPLFSPDLIRADLNAIWSTLLDVGVQPFRTSDRAAVEKLYRSTLASITSPMNVRQAWLAIAPVLGALNDGHVGLGFPGTLNEVPQHFPLFFGLSNVDDSLIVLRDRTNTIPVGSKVVTVDGISGDRFRDTALAAFGGQTRALHRERVTMAGAWTAIALFGDKPEYHAHCITPGGASIDATVAPTSAHRASGASRPEPYTYQTISNNAVGYIDYRSCEDLPRFQTFLKTTFDTIQRSPIRALVIDIRRNGGGDSELNDILWTYVTTKRFKQSGGVITKSCDLLKQQYGKEKYEEVYGDAAWRAPNGTILQSGMNPNDDLVTPGPLANRYNGPVYLLISTQTFSSAMSCALAAKDYGLATIVGEETGEPVNSTGEVYTEITPNTGLQAWLTTKVFLSPKPHPDGQGVVPDVIVPTTPADIAARRDPVLDKTLSLIYA
jgi:hypothetical protein